MSAESKKKVLDYVSKRAKDVDFVTKVAESMEEDKKGSWNMKKTQQTQHINMNYSMHFFL